MKGVKSHQIVADGLSMLENLTHRGAVGADPLMGDGAGMLVQIPDRFFREEMAAQGIDLPAAGQYAVGYLFMPQDAALRAHIEDIIARVGRRRRPAAARLPRCAGRQFLAVQGAGHRRDRAVPPAGVHRRAARISRRTTISSAGCIILRKVISGRIYAETQGARQRLLHRVAVGAHHRLQGHVPRLSGRRLLQGPGRSALRNRRWSLVHQRFSTNTFPSWKLAHPYRMVAHNGEINTLRGNVNWMAARQASVDSELFGNDISKLWPISYEGQSDTACFDNALEFLFQGGYSLAHAMMMLIPEAWAGNKLMAAERKAFYEYHAALMEPWDGPAAVAFTDGRQIGATLDRNGLRPARYIVTDDDRVIMASEAGVLPVAEEKIVKKWRLQPGKMLLIDLEKGRIISDEEIKSEIADAASLRAVAGPTRSSSWKT